MVGVSFFREAKRCEGATIEGERLSLLLRSLSFRIGFVVTAVIAFFVEVSCGEDASSNQIGGDGNNPPLVPQDAQVSGDPDAGMLMSTMRIAHLAPQIGPIDFCYQPARVGTFLGPVLGGFRASPKDDASGTGDVLDAGVGVTLDANAILADAAADAADGGAGQIQSGAYRSISKYFNLEAAGPVTVAIVEGGASSCANPITTATVTLDPGKLSTVVFAGTLPPPPPVSDGGDNDNDAGVAGASLELSAFTDDRTIAADKIRVRVIHAALGSGLVPAAGPLGVRAAGSKTTVLTDRVEPRRASTASQAVSVDGLGYVTAAPIPPLTSIAIGPATTDGGADAGFDPWQSKPMDLDLVGGSLHTAFVLTGASTTTFEVLWCADTTTSGDQTTCLLLK